MAHRADAREIKLANELRPKRRAASGVELLQNVEMLLQQLGSRQCAEIKHGVVDRIDAVSANRNHDITIARQHFGNVIVTLVTRYRLAVVAGTRPLQQRTTTGETRRVTAMHKQNDGERTSREVGRVMNRSAQFDW